MLYASAQEFLRAPRKSLTFFGMSGAGKSWLSRKLKENGSWLRYSIDERIAGHYLYSSIINDVPRAQRHEVARALSSEEIWPLTRYISYPRLNKSEQGIPLREFYRRQEQHRRAERNALFDVPGIYSLVRSRNLSDRENFVCDTGGSITDVVDPEDFADPILTAISARSLLVHIRAEVGHERELVRRFKNEPKPMYYGRRRGQMLINEYRRELSLGKDMESFSVWGFRQLIRLRKRRYEALSRWGVSINSRELVGVRDERDLISLVCQAFRQRDERSYADTRRIDARRMDGMKRALYLRRYSTSGKTIREIASDVKMNEKNVRRAFSRSADVPEEMLSVIFDELFQRPIIDSPSSEPANADAVERNLIPGLG